MIIDWLRARRGGSARTAKQRLQFVLVNDRAGLSPAKIEAMKDDLIAAISRHVDIDTDRVEISLTRDRKETATCCRHPTCNASAARALTECKLLQESGVTFDVWLLATVALLTIAGVAMIRSAIADNPELVELNVVRKNRPSLALSALCFYWRQPLLITVCGLRFPGRYTFLI